MGRVTYVQHTNLRANNLNGEAVLYFNKTKSVYYLTDIPKEPRPRDLNGTFDVVLGDKDGFPIFKNLKKDSLIFKTVIGPFGAKKCVLKEPLPKIEWQIQNERKKIGRYLCQKAVGKFGGRIYDAWFTTEIPISSGPYKLSGLPGLILEATSHDGRVNFLFKKLELDDDFDYRIVPPRHKWTFSSKEAYDRKSEEMRQDLILYFKSMGVDATVGARRKPNPDFDIEFEE